MTVALEVRNLRAGYAGREILKGVSFQVDADDFFAIIGPSGAGKSTLIRCVNRLVEPTGGQVLFHGVDLEADALEDFTPGVAGAEVLDFERDGHRGWA